MKIKRSLACVLLIASLMLNLCVTASASTDAGINNVNGFTVGELVPVDLTGVDPSNIISLPQTEPALLSDVNDPSLELSNDFDTPSITLSDIENAKDFMEISSNDSPLSRAPSYNLSSLSDVLAADSTGALYTISVNNGQLLQVELLVPQNLSLDYDLYLFAVDSATSELTQVAASIYGTNSTFMPESVGTINNSGSTLTYAILVHPNGNPSATDYFTLNVSTSNYTASNEANPTYAFEPNESAFYAVEFPNMTSSTYVTVPGGLNSPIDNDWFVVYNQSTTEFSGLEIANIPESVVVESYAVSTGNMMTKLGSTANGAVLPIASGYTYFRVCFSGNGTFGTPNYNITFTPALNATKALVLIAVNGYCQRYSSLFADRKTRPLFVMGSNIRVWVQYLTDNNIRVKANDTVSVSIFNPAWDNPNMQYSEGSARAVNSYDCNVSLRAPTLRGDRYDLVYTTVYSSKFGTLVGTVETALLNKYDDGETSRPCIHNGTCGLL